MGKSKQESLVEKMTFELNLNKDNHRGALGMWKANIYRKQERCIRIWYKEWNSFMGAVSKDRHSI